MSLLFENYSFEEVIYLQIRFNEIKFFSRNTNNTDENSVNKQNTHTQTHTHTHTHTNTHTHTHQKHWKEKGKKTLEKGWRGGGPENNGADLDIKMHI